MQSSSRNKTKVRVLAVHTTEGIMRAVDLRAWAAWPGSSHASADETGVLLAGAKDGFVDYELAAWTLRSGNPWSENIELCGWAKWKRDEWLSRPKLLDACARWLADRAVARGIPLVKLSPKEYAAGGAGVIGHVDHTVGYADGTHTDPGPNFPYDVVLDRARAYAGGAAPAPIEGDELVMDAEARKAFDEVTRLLGNLNGYPERAANGYELRASEHLNDGSEARRMLGVLLGWNAPATENEAAAVAALRGGAAPDVDESALAAALAPLLTSNLGKLSDADVDRISEAVADELARRQAS